MFYKSSRPTATGTRWSAYDHSDSLHEAGAAYARCRKSRTFILTDDSPDLERFYCSCCGRLLSDYGDAGEGYKAVYVDYSPTRKSFRPKHYVCAWGQLLGAIGTSYSLAEAAAAYQAAEGPEVRI